MHAVFSDGVFIENDSSTVRFYRTPAPTLEETRLITERIARRVHRWLKERVQESVDGETFAQSEPLLSACYNASIRHLTALGQRAGQPLMRAFAIPPKENNSREERTVAGFNLHVSIPIQGDDRRGLERQLQYMYLPFKMPP